MDYMAATMLSGSGLVLSVWSLYLCWPKKTSVIIRQADPELGDYKSINARD